MSMVLCIELRFRLNLAVTMSGWDRRVLIKERRRENMDFSQNTHFWTLLSLDRL